MAGAAARRARLAPAVAADSTLAWTRTWTRSWRSRCACRSRRSGHVSEVKAVRLHGRRVASDTSSLASVHSLGLEHPFAVTFDAPLFADPAKPAAVTLGLYEGL